MTLSEYLKMQGRGSHKDLSRLIKVHAPDISNWSSGSRPVPAHFCAAIQNATQGLVTRQELRPNDWHLIWPELVSKEAA